MDDLPPPQPFLFETVSILSIDDRSRGVSRPGQSTATSTAEADPAEKALVYIHLVPVLLPPPLLLYRDGAMVGEALVGVRVTGVIVGVKLVGAQDEGARVGRCEGERVVGPRCVGLVGLCEW